VQSTPCELTVTTGSLQADFLKWTAALACQMLRVLSEAGLVRCRAEGRRRLYRLEPARLRPMHEQAWSERLDRVDDYLKELQRQGERQ
jgi:DNA-binding transcriptional ArsR family regulator